jgi:hypothetical protein
MSSLFEKAVAEVVKLPPEAQEAIGAIILEELEDEQLWDAELASTRSQLSKLATGVRADIQAGRVKPSGFGGT